MPKPNLRPKQTTVETIARNLKLMRAHNGISQDELADKANVSRTQLGQIEVAKENPKLGTLEALADALGISLIELLTPMKPSRGE